MDVPAPVYPTPRRRRGVQWVVVYRNDLEALEARREAIAAEVAAKTRALDTAREALDAARGLPLLDNVVTSAPCRVRWSELDGDDRAKRCTRCSVRVYELAGLARDEAEHLIVATEGHLTDRYYQRGDGTIATRDCPVGVRRRWARRGMAVGALAIVAVAATWWLSREHERTHESATVTECRTCTLETAYPPDEARCDPERIKASFAARTRALQQILPRLFGSRRASAGELLGGFVLGRPASDRAELVTVGSSETPVELPVGVRVVGGMLDAFEVHVGTIDTMHPGTCDPVGPCDCLRLEHHELCRDLQSRLDVAWGKPDRETKRLFEFGSGPFAEAVWTDRASSTRAVLTAACSLRFERAARP